MNALLERTRSPRCDAWTHEDDLILAETILNRVREGGTQLEGFELAAGKLHRTAAAAGFRWNGLIRHHYTKELSDAKKERRAVRSHMDRYGDKTPRLRYVNPDAESFRRLQRTAQVGVRHHQARVADFMEQGNEDAARYAQDVVTDFEWMLQLCQRATGAPR